MSNEAVCDITILALKDLLKNFPRKKPVIKNTVKRI